MSICKKAVIFGFCYLLNNNVQIVQSFTTIKASSSSVSVSRPPVAHAISSCDEIDFNRNDKKIKMSDNNKELGMLASKSIMSILLSLNIMLVTTTALPIASHAEEYEAPTLFTGESTEICIKRGVLGKCIKAEVRTAKNDNDKATQYFSNIVKTNSDNLVENTYESNNENSELIKKLRQQTEDNKEKNARIVKQKTMMNDASASFGPFDRQVIILNTDGDTYSLLTNPQAMRLKEQGYISKKEKKFITQPTQDVLDATLNAPEDGGGFFGGLVRGVFGKDD